MTKKETDNEQNGTKRGLNSWWEWYAKGLFDREVGEKWLIVFDTETLNKCPQYKNIHTFTQLYFRYNAFFCTSGKLEMREIADNVYGWGFLLRITGLHFTKFFKPHRSWGMSRSFYQLVS